MTNHLSPIYAKLGVHIQVDLNRVIRREGRPTPGTRTGVPFGQ
jgi:hypothetical protein